MDAKSSLRRNDVRQCRAQVEDRRQARGKGRVDLGVSVVQFRALVSAAGRLVVLETVHDFLRRGVG